MAAIADMIKSFIFVQGDYEDDAAEAPAPKPERNRERDKERKEKRTSSPARGSHAGDYSAPGVKNVKVVNMPSAQMTIVIVKLDSYTGTKTIIDKLKERLPVVFNISRLDHDSAVRAVDAVYGASYAVDGKMQKVSKDIFIVTPRGVEVTGDITDQLTGDGDFNLDNF